MKNRIFAALLALAIGAPLYLLSAHAAPRQTSPAAPAALTAVLKAVPDGALRLTAALAPEDNALAEWQAQVQQEAERQQGPKGIDLGWWQSHYNDIIGYVYSPGTPISYPIAYDGDNEYYLHHDLYGNYSAYGTIFLDARANRDFTSQSNMLYGHHMADGTMFASISGYKQQWYYDAHPFFYLYTNEGTYRVDLFAGLIVPGYLALYLHSPGRIVCTLLLAAAAVGLCIGPHTLTAAALCYVPLCVGIMTQQPLLNALATYFMDRGQTVDYGKARGTGSICYAAISYVLGRVTAHFGSDAMPFAVLLILALLAALLTPWDTMKALQDSEQFTTLMVKQEELKTYPLGEVWAEFCRRSGVEPTEKWFDTVKAYEKDVLAKRG